MFMMFLTWVPAISLAQVTSGIVAGLVSLVVVLCRGQDSGEFSRTFRQVKTMIGVAS